MRAHQRERFQMPRWVRLAVYGVGLLCAFSGVLWLLLHHFVQVEGEFGPEPSPFQHPLLVLHGVVAAMLIWLFGLLWLTHVRRAWKRRRNWRSGGFMVLLLAWLAISGLGLYYLGSEQWRQYTGIAHWLAGIIATLWLPFHIWRGRRAVQLPP
ncbi:MAG: DUF4405 domain-containing protein [Rhodanobacteraceae bacterium]|nr:hypothetical protein [Xanthomonadales bacterium]MCP5474526.1 DUF4405 domain-containing protein [Rhodanobacteraceae bacterium]